MKTVAKRYAEFRNLGIGGIVGQEAMSCLAYARAEYLAEKYDIGVTWEYDDIPLEDLIDPECMPEDFLEQDHTVEYAYIEGDDGDHVAGLSGIIDADTNYRRIIEAELFLEAMPFSALGYRLLAA